MTMQAVRARRLIPLADEGLCVGEHLFRKPVMYDDGLLLLHKGRVVYAGNYAPHVVPAGVHVQDLGEVTLVPAAVNAHTHIQLSHLAGQTLWGQGFVPWLRSLIPLLAKPLSVDAVERAVRHMRATGTSHAGDYTSHGMAMVGQAAQRQGLGCTLLAEWFGFALPESKPEPESTPEFTPEFTPESAPKPKSATVSTSASGAAWEEAPNAASVWPSRCLPILHQIPQAETLTMAPVGHALYSTHATLLRNAHAWCVAHGAPFALHLAEFPEEEDALVSGTGALVDLYRPVVLPPEWQAPGLPPVALAQHLGLLGPQLLAVHCVHCTPQDVAVLAQTGTRVCLCPRSNAHLAVGCAPVHALARANVPLCFGTDGLTSNTDLDVWQEAVYLLQQGALPAQALLRLATCNGAAALHRDDVGALRPGMRGAWAILPAAMEESYC